MTHAEPSPDRALDLDHDHDHADAHDHRSPETRRRDERRLWSADATFIMDQGLEDLDDGDDDDEDEDDAADTVGGGGASSPDIETDAAAGPATATSQRGVQQSRRRRRKKHKDPGLKKRYRFLTHLLADLDSLVFIELGALYYHECSFFRFCFRAIPQFLFLAPKSESFPFLVPVTQSHVVSVLAPNLFCILLHLFTALPRARPEHRGYLHGGLFVDFVGQHAPTSPLELLVLDAVVLLLQCLLLAVHSDRENLRGQLKDVTPLVLGRDVVDDLGASSRSLDAAERGEAGEVRSDDHATTRDGEDSEAVTDDADEDEDDRERDPLTGQPLQEGEGGRTLRDELGSGLGVLGEYDILHTLRTASMDYESAAAHSLRTLGYTAAVTRWAARRGSAGTLQETENGDGNI